MWCHLCAQEFSDIENFKVHILKVHRRLSEELFSEDSDSDIPKSSQENVETSEDDDENEAVTVSRQAIAKIKPQISKFNIREKRKKLQKWTLPHRKKSAISFQEDSEQSDESTSNQASDSPVKGNESQIEKSESVQNNSQVFFINPFANQNVNNYAVGNQAVQPPLYSTSTPIIINPVVATSSSKDNESPFDFNSKNILKWFEKHKELCKDLKYPLPISLIRQITSVHKAIFDRYIRNSPGEEATAVLKVYKDLDDMINKHLSKVNDLL